MSLRERRELLALAAGQSVGVLVTLVRVAGSSYRAPGARLLVLPDGRTAGTISGGCLEADLLRKALWRVRDGAAIERYNTSFDDTAEIPYGLGCGGEVDLLLEPLGTQEASALLAALQATLDGADRRVLTVLPRVIGEQTNALHGSHAGRFGRVVLDAAGDVLFASEHIATETVVLLRRRMLDASFPEPSARERAGERTELVPGAFPERLRPAQRLVIFGAGEDARPLARLGADMGWTVVVVDGRAQQARAERFPEAAAVVVAHSVAAVAMSPADVAVVMTHSYEQDRQVLTELLRVGPRYVGLLGARHRSALLLEEASSAAGVPLARAVAQVAAPVGLSFGGDGPEAIALSITAQIQAVLQGGGEAVSHRRMALAEVERLLQQEGASAIRREICAADLSRAETREETRPASRVA